MQVDASAVSDAAKRLPRAEGQIRRAGFTIIASGLQQCATAQAKGDERSVDLEQMERLFLSLA